jgi:hypothetical protein
VKLAGEKEFGSGQQHIPQHDPDLLNNTPVSHPSSTGTP